MYHNPLAVLFCIIAGFYLFAACSNPGIEPVPDALSSCTLPEVPYTGPVSPLAIGLTIPPDVEIVQNEGQICFSRIPAGAVPTSETRLRVHVWPAGCRSSSCTITYERNGDMQIDAVNRRIRFLSRYMLEDYSGVPGPDGQACECTTDCGGGGEIEFDTGDLPEGVYQVELGMKVIGEIAIPFYDNSKCLSTAP
jgi:hypothetical protein